jgi:hypothetical protein
VTVPCVTGEPTSKILGNKIKKSKRELFAFKEKTLFKKTSKSISRIKKKLIIFFKELKSNKYIYKIITK